MDAVKTRDIVVTRQFHAPPERVWEAWTVAGEVVRWWGPDGFTAPAARMDVRPGGTSLVCMRSPEGQDMWMTWHYLTVEPAHRLEYVQNISDEAGNRIDPAVIGMPPEFPVDVHTVVTIGPHGAGTETTITERTSTSDFMLEVSKIGLEQCLDKMGKALAG